MKRSSPITHCSLRCGKAISFEAPEVVVAAKDSTLKHDPTQKVVVFGFVNEQLGDEYDLQWTQVRVRQQFREAPRDLRSRLKNCQRTATPPSAVFRLCLFLFVFL